MERSYYPMAHLPELSNHNAEVRIMLTAIVISIGLFVVFLLAMHEEGSF